MGGAVTRQSSQSQNKGIPSPQVADGENLATSHSLRQKFKAKKLCVHTHRFQAHTAVKLDFKLTSA